MSACDELYSIPCLMKIYYLRIYADNFHRCDMLGERKVVAFLFAFSSHPIDDTKDFIVKENMNLVEKSIKKSLLRMLKI